MIDLLLPVALKFGLTIWLGLFVLRRLGLYRGGVGVLGMLGIGAGLAAHRMARGGTDFDHEDRWRDHILDEDRERDRLRGEREERARDEDRDRYRDDL